jgi:coproporphyrinogen III oxidase-like Fe-S oxidoreductase
MKLQVLIRNILRKLIVENSASFTLDRRIPDLAEYFQDIEEFGLYLHIPFCRQICPYCPYNKEIFRPEVAESYVNAVIKEVDCYSALLGEKPVTTFYIGGGTPTTMLYSGLDKVLDHIYGTFNMQCASHMESHPNDLSPENLKTIKALGVAYLSIGVEALQDHHLNTLYRAYTTNQVKSAISRAVGADFKCVNADFIFALPNQTYREIQQSGHMLVEMGLDQIAAYPLFTFPYTEWATISKNKGYKRPNVFVRRKMLHILEDLFYAAGYERTSVWAFTKKGIPKYCSVTVPLYVGLGASGGSYLRDIFYLNTFNVQEYITSLEAGRWPIALSLSLSADMQMAGWLYWRIYETGFNKLDFERRFGIKFEKIYGKYIKPLAISGFLKDDPDKIVLSDRGAYWLHYLQDLFSFDYISKLWGISKYDPWPERVVL